MALNKSTLNSDLKTRLKEAFISNGAPNEATADSVAENIASAISEAVDTYVRTALVSVTAITGQIAVEGTATAQSNIIPITIEGGVS
jgi:hypothetical protein